MLDECVPAFVRHCLRRWGLRYALIFSPGGFDSPVSGPVTLAPEFDHGDVPAASFYYPAHSSTHGLVISLFYIPRFAVRSLLRRGVAFEPGYVARKAGVSPGKGQTTHRLLAPAWRPSRPATFQYEPHGDTLQIFLVS